MTDEPLPAAIPAATLVLLREAAGAPEVLMVERSGAMAFAPGALVFPGGRVDPGDRALAAAAGADDPDEAAARIAAIRETIEEVGLAAGITPSPSQAALTRLRAALGAGAAIGRALDAAGCAVDPQALVPFARWRPSHRAARVFDTRFYLHRLAPDAPAASVDGTENVRLLWTTAAAALDAVAAGAASVIFPTRRNLERLARFATVDAAFADAAAHPVVTISPWREVRDGVESLCIPDGLGYPVTAEPVQAVQSG